MNAGAGRSLPPCSGLIGAAGPPMISMIGLSGRDARRQSPLWRALSTSRHDVPQPRPFPAPAPPHRHPHQPPCTSPYSDSCTGLPPPPWHQSPRRPLATPASSDRPLHQPFRLRHPCAANCAGLPASAALHCPATGLRDGLSLHRPVRTTFPCTGLCDGLPAPISLRRSPCADRVASAPDPAFPCTAPFIAPFSAMPSAMISLRDGLPLQRPARSQHRRPAPAARNAAVTPQTNRAHPLIVSVATPF